MNRLGWREAGCIFKLILTIIFSQEGGNFGKPIILYLKVTITKYIWSVKKQNSYKYIYIKRFFILLMAVIIQLFFYSPKLLYRV